MQILYDIHGERAGRETEPNYLEGYRRSRRQRRRPPEAFLRVINHSLKLYIEFDALSRLLALKRWGLQPALFTVCYARLPQFIDDGVMIFLRSGDHSVLPLTRLAVNLLRQLQSTNLFPCKLIVAPSSDIEG